MVPAVGKPGFELEENEIEFGVGIHGEPGYRKTEIKPSHYLASEIITKIKDELGFDANSEYGVLVNGLGGTPYMEQFVFMNDVKKILAEDNVNVTFKKSGNLMTALDMTGLSLTIIKLEEGWLDALNHKGVTPGWGK